MAVEELGINASEASANNDGSNREELLNLQADESDLVFGIGFLVLVARRCATAFDKDNPSSGESCLRFGLFGAAVTRVRRRSEGHLTRLRLLPVAPWRVWADLLLAGAAIDLLQFGGVVFEWM